MQNAQKNSEKAAIDYEKTILDKKKEIEETSDKDPMRHRLRSELYSMEMTYEILKQRALHDQLQLQKRKEVSKKSYWKAREAKKEWPDKEEFEGYKAAQRLRAAPRSWDSRVPKLNQSGAPNPPPAKPKSEGSHGGGH